MDSSVLLPITLWNSSKPLFRISTISITPDFRKLVTGSYNGQLCIWDLNLNEKNITPRNILIGHKSSVTGLASTNDYVISCCEDRMICRWNLDDGYCSKTNTSLFIYRKLQFFTVKSENNEEHLFAYGDYSDIFIIHSFTLQVIHIFHSTNSNFWISSFQLITSQDGQIVSGITTNGCVKLWVFDKLVNNLQYETQSYILPIANIVEYMYNASLTLVLLVSTNCWMLYDLNFSNCMCKVEAYNKEILSGGSFCDNDIVIWTECGKFYLYSVNKNEHKLITEFHDNFNETTLFKPAISLINGEAGKYLIKGDSQGRISFWKIKSNQEKLYPKFSTTLADNWLSNKNAFFDSFINHTTVTCCIYVSEFDKFFVGCLDGSVVSLPASDSLLYFYFKSVQKPEVDIFFGHIGKINCLLYPYENQSYYNKSHLVSGGSDFSVCLWDITKGILLFRFCVQSGEILRLIIPPEDCNMTVKLSICSISSDHSVAIFNLKDQRCVILTSRHTFPVVTVHWKPLDDFIIVECFDGTAYVWQMETGHLDRVLNGVWAQEVIYACSETQSNMPAFNFFIKEQNDKENSVKQTIFKVNSAKNSFPFRLNRFLSNNISESHMFLCDLESIFDYFSANFESETLDYAINSNASLLTKALNNDLQKKSLTLLEKVWEKTETFQSKAQNLKKNNVNQDQENKINHDNDENCVKNNEKVQKLIRFFLSSVHYWGLNPSLDEIASSELGLLKPEQPICFGILSQPGMYSLFLPTTEKSRQNSSCLFTSFCVAMIALSKILLSCYKTYSKELTDSKIGFWEELISFYEQFCIYLNQNLSVPKPKVEILAKAWQAKSLPFRKIVRKLLCSFLQALDERESAYLLEFWYKYLPHFKILDKTLPEKVDFENIELKTVALVLFGAVGSDLKFKSLGSSNQENYVYQTCASFVYLMLLPVCQKLRFNTLQILAIDFIGRGYIVWEQFLKIEKIIPILFKICANESHKSFEFPEERVSLDYRLSARNTLKAIAIARTAAFIHCLKNEISQIKLGEHHNFLRDNSKSEVLFVLTFLLEKSPYIMLLYLNDVVSIIVYCVDFSHLRQENLADLIPVMQKFRQVHHSVSSQRIAVGSVTGSLVLLDLKTGKIQEVPAHKDSVSALKFSDDGKFLVSYSCYENRIVFWQVLTGMFGLGHVQIKFTKSFQTYKIHDEEIRNHLEIASLTWTDKKTVMLRLCDGTEDSFHF